MAMVIVIMLNILIAQMSYTYSEAKRTAKLQYAVDTMLITARLEYSRFARWVGIWLLLHVGKYLDDVHPKGTTTGKQYQVKNIKTQRMVTLLCPVAD